MSNEYSNVKNNNILSIEQIGSGNMEILLPRLRIYFFVALVALAALGFELVQTRVLSALYYNNIVYMTVTIALLGFGISGVLASTLLRHQVKSLGKVSTWCAGFLAISMVCCIHLVSDLPSILPYVPTLYKMILSYFILVIPFMFAGAALSLTFMQYGSKIFSLYFSDLCASAFAVILFSTLLWPLGATNFIWLCTLASLLAFIIRASTEGVKRHEVVIFTLGMMGIFFLAGKEIIPNKPEYYKSSASFAYVEDPELSAWTTIAKIDVYSNLVFDLKNKTKKILTNHKIIFQDNDAHTYILGKEDILSTIQAAQHRKPSSINALAYFINPHPENVLVIGVGGGKDLVESHIYGATRTDGVEINPAIINFVTKRFREYALWPNWKDIKVYQTEGRHFVRHTKKKYDVIVMSGVDTFAALNSGAYVLSENYLYTIEAIKDYLNILKPNGVMVISRWFFLQPRESLRLANLFVNAAKTVGIGNASQRILVIKKDSWAGTFITRTPFTAEEVKRIADIVNRENYSLIYVPKVLGNEQQVFEKSQFANQFQALSRARAAYSALITADTLSARINFEKWYPFRIEPVYDDRPFFFEYYKTNFKDTRNENWAAKGRSGFYSLESLRGPLVHYVLYILLFLTTLACVIGIGIPLLVFEREGIKVQGAKELMLFFSSLGMGFMFVEIGLMQWLNLYLGHPMYSLVVVLAGLLFFAGLGSLFASRMKYKLRLYLQIGMIGTAILIPAWLIMMKYIIPISEQGPLGFRIAIVLISLLPLGICMGIPFATGLRYLADYSPRFIPWAWGINGLTSVATSILAVILAMKFGFTAIIMFSSIIYVIGYLAFLRHFNLSSYSPTESSYFKW